MKPWMPVALLVAMSPVALAKPTPIELPTTIVKAGIINRGSLASAQENMVRSGPCASERTLKRRNHR